MTLSGKHALVIGGGSGSGIGLARALADQGAIVTITDRRKAVLEEVARGVLHPLEMDVREEASVTRVHRKGGRRPWPGAISACRTRASPRAARCTRPTWVSGAT